MVHTNLAKSKNAFEHVLGESILLIALGQTIAFCEAKMLCLNQIWFEQKRFYQKLICF